MVLERLLPPILWLDKVVCNIVNDVGVTIKTKKINKNKKEFNYGKGLYHIDLSRVIALDKWRRPILYYNVNKPNPLIFKGIPFKPSEIRSPEDLKAFNQSHAYRELLKDPRMVTFAWVIVAIAIISVVGVSIYSNYQMGELNSKLADITMRYLNATAGILVRK